MFNLLNLQQIIFDIESIKSSRHEDVRKQIIQRLTKLIKEFDCPEFSVEKDENVKEKDYVEEEIILLKKNHDLKTYDDKKHFTLAAMEIAKYALENSEYSCILDICEKITNDTK